MKKAFSILLLVSISHFCLAQQTDEAMIRQIYDQALTNGKAYTMLDYLSNKIGQRLTGSTGAAKAVEWTRDEMKRLGFDSVWLQPVMVPHWVRGAKEVGKIIGSKKGPTIVNVIALGNSVGTGVMGVTANVIEVKSLEELSQLGEANIKGKIVFFNRPMDPTKIRTFEAYGGAVDQRVKGPSEAAKYGAVAALVRSMSTNIEDYPHTGTLMYDEAIKKIPALAISTLHADALSKQLQQDKTLKVYLQSQCQMLADVPSFNVVGEIKGTDLKNEIIVVGGHLDSWDPGQGAHDDGAGCVHAIEVLRILKDMNYKPHRTIRAVMFMNEENGLRGGTKYAELALQNKEKHVAAIESDAGGFSPRGISIAADETAKKKIQSWKPLMEPYGVTDFSAEGGGADIGPLEPQGVALMELLPDSQRYFSYHHTKEDTFDKVDQRELELGAASIASIVYLIDKYGLK